MGSSIKEIRKADPFPTSPPCPQVSAFDQPFPCGRPHLAPYTALWSDSVIAGAHWSHHQGILLLPGGRVGLRKQPRLESKMYTCMP